MLEPSTHKHRQPKLLIFDIRIILYFPAPSIFLHVPLHQCARYVRAILIHIQSESLLPKWVAKQNYPILWLPSNSLLGSLNINGPVVSGWRYMRDTSTQARWCKKRWAHSLSHKRQVSHRIVSCLRHTHTKASSTKYLIINPIFLLSCFSTTNNAVCRKPRFASL